MIWREIRFPPEKVEGIVVKAELPAHTPESVPEITMRLCEFDRGKLMDLFLKDSTITYEHSFDTGHGSMCYAYQTEDKKFLTIENGNLTYYAARRAQLRSRNDHRLHADVCSLRNERSPGIYVQARVAYQVR